MKDHPIWSDCKHCNRLGECQDPFPTSGHCPNPNDHQCTIPRHLCNAPEFSYLYMGLLDEDISVTSLFMRWRCGLIPTNEDFLSLREKAITFERENAATENTNEFFCLFREIIFEPILNIAGDFFAYQKNGEIPPTNPPVVEVLLGLQGNAVLMAHPTLLKEYERIGGEWSRWVLDIIKIYLWHLYGGKHLELDAKADDAFRIAFEEEWNNLLPYQDIFYGFRVIPKLSPEHFVRYLRLPHGDERIRIAVGNYFTHQATEYPHMITVLASRFTEVAFEKRLRLMYAPLIESLTEDILKNMSIHGPDRVKIRPDIQTEVWRQYEHFRKDFKFYFKPKNKKHPFGKLGIIDFSGNPQARQRFDQKMKNYGLSHTSDELAEVGFPYYLRQRFRKWINDVYPPDKVTPSELSLDAKSGVDEKEAIVDRITDDTNVNTDRNILIPQEPAAIGRLGTKWAGVSFLTIKQAADHYGIGVDQLRYLDRNGYYSVYRVEDVFDKPWPLKPRMRIYPLTEEAQREMRVAIARLKKKSSHLEGEEFDRKTAARMLKVSTSLLRKWEIQLNIKPRRKGRIVVYDRMLVNEIKKRKNLF